MFLQKDKDGNWALAEYTSGLGIGDLGHVKPTALERAAVDHLSDMGVNSSVLAGSIDDSIAKSGVSNGTDTKYKSQEASYPHPDLKVLKDSNDNKEKVDIARLSQTVNSNRTGTERLRLTGVVVPDAVSSRAQKIAGIFGKRVVFFRGDNRQLDPGGVTLHRIGDVVFVNVDSGFKVCPLSAMRSCTISAKTSRLSIKKIALAAVQGVMRLSSVAKYHKQLKEIHAGKTGNISIDLA